MQHKRFLALGLAAAMALSLALTGCGSSSSSTGSSATSGSSSSTASGAEVVVGLSTSLTGGTGDMGTSSLNGMKMALEAYNAKNPKYKIKLVPYDDQAKPETAVQNVTRLTSQDHAVIVLGPTNSGSGAAEIPILEKNKVPLLDNVATGVPLTLNKDKTAPNPWVFRVSMYDGGQVPTLLKGLQAKGVKKIGLLNDTSGYGVFGHDTVKQLAGKYGLTIVGEESFKIGDTDMTAQLQKLKDAGAEAITTYALAPEIAALLRSSDKLAWYPPMYGSWTWAQPKLLDLAGKDLLKKFHIYIAQSFDVNSSDAAKKFGADYKAKFPSDPFYAVCAAQGYDSMKMALQVIDQAGPDPQKIRDSLESLQGFQGLTQAHGFSAKDHESIHEDAMFLATYDADMNVVPAK